MDQRGLFTAIYAGGYIKSEAARINSYGIGTDAWVEAYRSFIKWFDGVVAGITVGAGYAKQLAPPLGVAIDGLLKVTELYSIVRELFPITPGDDNNSEVD